MDDVKNEMPAEPKTPDFLNRYPFLGSYDHSIDVKGRIVVPNAYRNALGDSFVISVTRDTKGIAIYTNDVFEALIEELFALNKRKPAIQEYLNNIGKFSFPNAQLDNQGRLQLPAKLRMDKLKNAKDIEIIGAFDHIEIVGAEASRLSSEKFNENLESILEEIANMD